METRPMKIALAAAGLFCLVTPSFAQIASYQDEHGKLVYTNDTKSSPARAAAPAHGRAVGQTTPADRVEVVLPDRLERIIREAADRHKLDPALVKAVIGVESAWNPMAISRKGALGLMQLNPSTAQRLGIGNAFDPAQNIEGGARYLRSLLDRYKGDLEKTLAAYNAGEGAVDRSGGIPNIAETRAYVRKVTNTYFRPGSGRDTTLYEAPRDPVRRVVDEQGRVVFTNE